MAGRQNDTRAEIRRVAMELFTQQGYEATSLREIAERLGVTKAALYYHFRSKEDIVRSLFGDYLAALDELVAWASAQARGPELLAEVIDRMLHLSADHGRQAMQFALANQHVVRYLHPGKESTFERLSALFDAVTEPGATVQEALRIRVALLSVNLTVFAAQGLDAPEEEINAAVREIAHRLA
ncbi:TetR/AcrR family transcriptional regulator [Krasilnikovia sp. MM14-A1259]|uniref:TetR/AcrR family transcriptional regulator n=1 Tax=Krasilnikovia sp. MM14-A1259 TaxID=3373539 RepID=UPI0038127910